MYCKKLKMKKRERGKQFRDPDRLAKLQPWQLSNLYNQLEITKVVHRSEERLDCHETDLPLQRRNGYAPLRTIFHYGSSNGYQPASVVLAYHGQLPQPGDWVSHLCDNSRCVRLEHLCWESSAKNHRRKNCPGLVSCRCCNVVHDACIHEPPCKKETNRLAL